MSAPRARTNFTCAVGRALRCAALLLTALQAFSARAQVTPDVTPPRAEGSTEVPYPDGASGDAAVCSSWSSRQTVPCRARWSWRATSRSRAGRGRPRCNGVSRPPHATARRSARGSAHASPSLRSGRRTLPTPRRLCRPRRSRRCRRALRRRPSPPPPRTRCWHRRWTSRSGAAGATSARRRCRPATCAKCRVLSGIRSGRLRRCPV